MTYCTNDAPVAYRMTNPVDDDPNNSETSYLDASNILHVLQQVPFNSNKQPYYYNIHAMFTNDAPVACGMMYPVDDE